MSGRQPGNDGFRHDPRQRIFYRFAILAGHYARALAAMYSPSYGLSMSDWKVLAMLGVNAPMSATEAGQRTSLQPDKVTRRRQPGRQGRGLRRRDPTDKRRIILMVSAEGRRAFRAIDRVRFAIESEMLEPLSKAELHKLYELLGKLDRRALELFGERPGRTRLVASHEMDRAKRR